MKYIYFLLLTFLFSITGCKDEGTKPQEFSPGYQQDIPWPSLADSPWPMNHHDPQSTGRSQYAGPSLGIVKSVLDSFYLYAGIIIDPDSNFYFSALFNSYGLYCFNKNLNLKWKLTDSLEIGIGHSTPLISNDNTIYLTGGSFGYLYAIYPEGKIKWKFKAGIWVYHQGIMIDKSGIIYFVNANGTLFAIDKNGNQLWNFSNNDFLHYDNTTFTISPDGKTLYVPGINITLYAFNLDTRNIKWSFGSGVSYAAPTVVTAIFIY